MSKKEGNNTDGNMAQGSEKNFGNDNNYMLQNFLLSKL